MNHPFRCFAVDMGAGSIRVLLGTVSSEGIELQEIHRFKNEIKIIENHDRWDIQYIVNEIFTGIKKGLEICGDQIQSIGVDSWGVDFVLLDEHDNLLEIPIAYRDPRTNGMQGQWEKLLSKEKTFQKTGINFYIFNSLLQLLSIKDSAIIERTKTILFIPNYIYFRLTGQKSNELSIASTSQLVNVDSGKMDADVLKLLNIPESKFATIITAGNKIENLNVAELPANTIKAVSICSHDTASAVVAVPAESSGFAFISTGTWCIVGVESDIPALSDTALNNGFTNERGYNNTYRVLKNILGLWLIQGLQKSFGDLSFDELEKFAENTTDSTLYIDPEDELFFNPEDMKAAFDSFFRKTNQTFPSSPGEYIKCAYNSLCLSFKKHIELLETMLGREIKVIHIIGGGSRSDYLCRETARICRKRVIAGPVEGSGLGNILVQAVAMGYLKNIEEGRALVRKSFNCKQYNY